MRGFPQILSTIHFYVLYRIEIQNFSNFVKKRLSKNLVKSYLRAQILLSVVFFCLLKPLRPFIFSGTLAFLRGFTDGGGLILSNHSILQIIIIIYFIIISHFKMYLDALF